MDKIWLNAKAVFDRLLHNHNASSNRAIMDSFRKGYLVALCYSSTDCDMAKKIVLIE